MQTHMSDEVQNMLTELSAPSRSKGDTMLNCRFDPTF